MERVQDISEEDAKAEGIDYDNIAGSDRQHPYGFMALWDRINFKRGYGWGANPWVWVLAFDVIKQNVDEYLKEAA